MPIILDKKLYEYVKALADHIYLKPSGYKSGYIVKTYKKLGGRYGEDKKPKHLKNWFSEAWADIANQQYPVYRPTKRINKITPLLASEIDKRNLQDQIKLKQLIKGDYNLPPFKIKKNLLI
jgi:hypothetical protein